MPYRLPARPNWRRRWRAGLICSLSLVLVATPTDPVAGARATAPPPPPAPGVACPAERPDEAAAKVTARHCGQRVEVADLRSETRAAWANPDGTMSLEVSTLPVRARRADGSWAAVDLSLKATAGGLRPATSAVDVTFSAGGRSPLVTLVDRGRELALSWPDTLPTPTVAGDAATYREVLPGVDLVVRATPTGFATVLVVKTRDAAADPRLRSLAFRSGGDVRLSRASDGTLRASAGGRVIAAAPPPVMWDSSPPAKSPQLATPSTDRQPGDGATVRGVGTRLTPGGDLVLLPDAAALAAPGATLPFYIDPSFSLTSTKWAYANSSNTNTSADGIARVGNDGTGLLYRSFFEFGIAPLAGKQITASQVNVVLDHSWSCGPTPTSMFRTGAITVASGGRMAWTTYPLPSGGTFLATANSNANESGSCGTIQPDMNVAFGSSAMTADLQAAATAAQSTYTVALCACDSSGSNETSANRWKKWFTTNTTLLVTYNSYPTVGTRSTVPATTCVTGSTRPFINTATPQLRAVVSDPDGSTVRAEFEWWEVGGSTKIGSVLTGPAASGSTLTATVPAGAFADAGDYRWRVRANDGILFSAWSAYCEFTVDTTGPASTPGVSSTTYPEHAWGGSAGTPEASR
jgi:hypothetical protein